MSHSSGHGSTSTIYTKIQSDRVSQDVNEQRLGSYSVPYPYPGTCTRTKPSYFDHTTIPWDLGSTAPTATSLAAVGALLTLGRMAVGPAARSQTWKSYCDRATRPGPVIRVPCTKLRESRRACM